MKNQKQFSKVSCFILDVDGVLTDGNVLVLDNGLQARRMSIKDGFALQMAIKKGYKIVIVSGGNSPQVADRLQKLGVIEINMSVADKKKFVSEFKLKNGLSRDQLLYMGDDLPDIPVMSIVGVACCPADAVKEVKNAVDYIAKYNGGDACVREVIEKVLKANDDWEFSIELTSQ